MSVLLSPHCPILYIDDSSDDRVLVAAAIRRTNARFTLFTADSPESAAPHFAPRPLNDSNSFPRPALVLLDYDLGLHTGADFLIWLRIQKQMTTIPVIMYSGSSGTYNVTQCYALGATHFLRKPQVFSGIERIIRTLEVCMRFSPPRFGPLTRLQEYEPAQPAIPVPV